jgi:hypothetical protein
MHIFWHVSKCDDIERRYAQHGTFLQAVEIFQTFIIGGAGAFATCFKQSRVSNAFIHGTLLNVIMFKHACFK